MDVVTSSPLMSLEEYDGLKTLSSLLLAVTHLTLSSICAKRDYRTGGLIQINRELLPVVRLNVTVYLKRQSKVVSSMITIE